MKADTTITESRKADVFLRNQFLAGFLNQIISSVTNFIFALYLLQTLEIREYGIYNLTIAAMLFFGGAAQGCFLVQMAVLLPARDIKERANFSAKVLLVLSSVIAGFLFLTAISTIILKASAINGSYIITLNLTVFLSGMYILKDFYIRLAFCNSRVWQAVQIHSVLAVALLICLFVLKIRGVHVDLNVALGVYAVAHLASAGIGHIRAKLDLTGHSLGEISETLHALFVGGKWALVTNLVFTLRSQAHTIIVVSMLGPIGVAKLSAARLLVTPAIVALPAMSQVALPHLARLREAKDLAGMKVLQRKIALILTGVAISYSVFLLVAYPFISTTIFDERYEGLFWIVVFWCIYTVILAPRSSLDWMVQALRAFRLLAAINTVSAVVALLAAALLAYSVGITGAVIGVALGELFVLAGLWWAVTKSWDQ